MSQLPTDAQNVPTASLTSHAILVPWGLFAQRIGLVKRLEQVPIPQRQRAHPPQTKLIEFLVAILTGCAYLQDISRGPHPLDQDQTVAWFWGQEQWADYSGVSRTLHACTEETVAVIRTALQQVSRPFIDQEVMLALRGRGVLVYDGDLTGRPVSNSSTTYPGVAFGWMSDTVRLGYQAAMVSMHSPTYGRLWLSVEQHPGDTVSVTQAAALVQAAEAQTGARPWRRTGLLTARIAAEKAQLQATETELSRAQARLEQTRQCLDQLELELPVWQQRVTELEADYRTRNRPERPHSRLAQARRKLQVRERRWQRRCRDLARDHRRLERCQRQVLLLQSELLELEQRLAQFAEDNRTNPWPIQAIFRLDGGFGSGSNVALLIEMGYEVYSKAKGGRVIHAQRRQVTSMTTWTEVGKNSEMVAWGNVRITHCPYPLEVALERFYTGDKKRHAVLLHYGDTKVLSDLPGWFHFYNRRQDIEAGIKEGKNVFQMHHLKVRSLAGLVIQEQFAAFAANFVRWAAAWLYEMCPDAPAPFSRAPLKVKHMVRIAANTSAWVIGQPQSWLLRFTELSAFADVELVIRDSAPLQLALPFFEKLRFSHF
jgi:hypothetical protein